MFTRLGCARPSLCPPARACRSGARLTDHAEPLRGREREVARRAKPVGDEPCVCERAHTERERATLSASALERHPARAHLGGRGSPSSRAVWT